MEKSNWIEAGHVCAWGRYADTDIEDNNGVDDDGAVVVKSGILYRS